MGIKRIKKWLAWLLTAAMLIGLPAPAAFADSPSVKDVAGAALAKVFGYYQTQRGGALAGWEDLAAAYIAGEDLTKYALPPTTSANSTSVLISLMKGDMEGAKGFAAGLAGDLKAKSFGGNDALEVIAAGAYNRSTTSELEKIAEAAVNAGIACLLAAQEPDGGFWNGYDKGSDADTTGFALAALAPFTATHSTADAAVNKALSYLKSAQMNSGGFGMYGDNANSAAAVLWGLCALGETLDAWKHIESGKTPLDALLSFQDSVGGGFGYKDDGGDNEYATKQAALALAQLANGNINLANITENSTKCRSLTVGVVGANGDYVERPTVNAGDTLSQAIARVLTSDTVDLTEYHCYADGVPITGDAPSISAIPDGAKLLAIHNTIQKITYFKAKDDDGIGVNEGEIPFGESVTLQLMITSAAAISDVAPLSGIGVDGDGDGYADGATDENGNVTLSCFIDAGAYSVYALRYSYDSNYQLVQLIGNDTAILPAKVVMSGGAAQKATVSVRVEGVSGNVVFKPALTVGNSGGKRLTVLDAVKDALEADEIAYVVGSGGYISSIDGVAAAGMLGWLYNFMTEDYLKGEQSVLGMASDTIESGDEIVVYYGDYSKTLFPSASFTLNADGSVALTVKAWWNGTLSPAPDVRVSWAENTAFAFAGVTGADGTLIIPATNAPEGSHTLQIEKMDAGVPVIVRLAPGYTVKVTREGVSPAPPPSVATNEVYIKVTGPSGTMFARKSFPWHRGVTPLDLLKETKLEIKIDAAGEYVKSIGGFEEFAYGPNSGWLYKVNGIETIRESAAYYKLNAGDELEWFYTRDYTQEAGSRAWSSAPAAESGSSGSVTLRPEAESANGVAKVALRDEDVKKAVAEALRDKAGEIVIAPAIKGDAKKVSIDISAASALGVAEEAKAKLTLKTALGDLSVAGKGLAALARSGSGTVTLSVEREADVVSALVALDGSPVDRVEGGVKLRVPLAEKPGAGTVALLARDDGTEEVILLSSVKSGALVAVLDGSARIRVADKSRPFDDVSEKAWFKADADFVSARELFRGTGENAFSGELPMTRAMLAAVFHRLAGAPSAEGSAFSDVADAAWYREAAAWASAAGVIRGVDGDFAGDAEITREQLAAMAMRFAASESADMGKPAELTGFADRSSVSAWALESMKWAVGTGLLTGDASGRLNAGAPATRAETAAILRRFVENWTEAI